MKGVCSSRMSFDQREWVNEIATGIITGLVSGAAAATFVPSPPFLDSMFLGGVVGMVTGVCVQPVRWLLNRRPGAADPSTSGEAVRPKTEDFSS
jgi:ammonia channel protein AmtB